MKKKVVHRFPISFAQATSVHDDNMLLLETVHSKDLARAADHAKKATIEGAWVRHTLFKGKRLPLEQVKELKKDLTLNNPFLEETH